MRKKVIIVLCSLCAVLGFFTLWSAEGAFRSDWQLPAAVPADEESYRLVLITQELETPFWEKVGAGAAAQAEQQGVILDVWGSYGNNREDFLKQIEIALHSKVDGVIVQGLDTEEFKVLTKEKAAFYGIPVITVANDVPVEESLRKTFVGSDHYAAGKMLAHQLVKEMGGSGQVVVLGDVEQQYSQQQRLQGVAESLAQHAEISTVYAESGKSDEEIVAATQNILNQHPTVEAFIALNANHVGPMMKEISRRAQLEPYYLYSFDDGSETASLLDQGKLDAMIQQSPEQMGEQSVELMMQWLRNEVVPLESNGYTTDIRIVKGAVAQP
ncbi:ribose transport system substrate-binding protein [Planomicrobium stackebrandtii]|uniref:Ribose transport system substrate-binding protein n=1 Tax=Planomicrobium stackebrandtii TaxID=253160 RepID=A0ABU0GZG2_9BACL|nr:substrate-binding domain-containing protein [Planomicrobium stackebrandtii]MDQ0430758.1 ribose transport system substrate-binding protein [Planomicrobium stackebrandtii]